MDVKDFFNEVKQGNIAEYSLMHKFGRNSDIPNNSWALISPSNPISGIFPSSPTSVRIKAGGNAADTGSGIGAREITIIGIDENLLEVSKTIITSGVNASSATTTSFWRLYRAYVSQVGTYGETNVGDIVIEDSSGNNEMLVISADNGQTQHGAYSVPSGKIGHILSVHLTTDASKAGDFRLFVRDNFTNNQPPMTAKRLRLYFDGVLGQIAYAPSSPSVTLNPLSDIWVEARGRGANTEVSVDFEILLRDIQPQPHIRRT